MFVVDDILLAPLKGLTAICRQVQEAARQDLENQKQAALAALAELHQRLESGQIHQQGFDLQEAGLLDELERIERTLDPGA